MPAQLPPTRPLPDPDRMLAEILSETRPASIRRRGRAPRVVGAIILAAAAVTVTAVALPAVFHDETGTIAASPTPGADAPTPAPTSTHPTTPNHPTTGRVPLGTTQRFEHFSVTVDRVHRSPSFGILVHAEVCVRALPADQTGDTVRVGWEPWTVVNAQGRAAASLRSAAPGAQVPTDLFPREGYLRVGKCVSGWIPFNADEHADVVAVRYADAMGELGAWDGR